MKKVFKIPKQLGLLIIFLLLGLTILTGWIIWQSNKNNSSIKTNAEEKIIHFGLGISDDAKGEIKYSPDEIKQHFKTVIDALYERLNYLETPNFSEVYIYSQDEIDKTEKEIREYSESYQTLGYFNPPSGPIVLSSNIFQSSSLNYSHATMGHEMIHSFVKSRETNRTNLVEEGMTEYLAGKYLYGAKGVYPEEVKVTQALLATFKRLGYSNPDDILQKIMFQEGLGPGLDSRLNKYLPENKTSAFAYLNSLLNDGDYDKAIAWLQGIKKEETPKTKTDTDKEKAKSTPSFSILPSGEPETWSLGNVTDLLHNVISLALLLAGGIAAIYIIIGGISYLTAYGNEEKASNAKKTITWALIGLLLIVLAEVFLAELWRFITPTPVTF